MTRSLGITISMFLAGSVAACGQTASGPDPTPGGPEVSQPADVAAGGDRPAWATRVAAHPRGAEIAVDLDVGTDFTAVRFDGTGEAQRIFLVWSSRADYSVHAGLLSADGKFTSYPGIARKFGGSYAVAVGGPPGQRRIYFAWFEASPWRLMRAVVDESGRMVAPPAEIGQAYSAGRIQMAGTPTGAVIAFAWADDAAAPLAWQPFTLTLDTNGQPGTPTRVGNAHGQTADIMMAAADDGRYAVLFTDTNPWITYLRRFDATGHPLEAPLSLSSNFRSVWAQVVELDGSTQHELVIGMTTDTGDQRLFSAPIDAPVAPHELGLMGSAVPAAVAGAPGFQPPAPDVVTAARGGQATLMVGYRHVLARDPNYLGCLEAPPIDAEYRVQAIGLDGPMRPLGSAMVFDWQRAAPDEQAPEGIRSVPSADGRSATVLWVDRGLHLETIAF